MYLREENGLRILNSDMGFKLRRKGDESYFTDKVYLGIKDSPDNYEEISDEDIAFIKARQEAEERARQSQQNKSRLEELTIDD